MADTTPAPDPAGAKEKAPPRRDVKRALATALRFGILAFTAMLVIVAIPYFYNRQHMVSVVGLTVQRNKVGETVFTRVMSGTSAAQAGIVVSDVLEAINEQPVPNGASLSQLNEQVAGWVNTPVTFTVRKDGKGAPGPVPLTLKRTKVEVGGQSVYLDVGIEPQDQVDYAFPFPISISVTDIGGPSAGLAMTLGVIDALTSGSLTGGHTIAATGTMDAAGNVGDVGGVAQKTVAVENAGASLFLVPPEEYKVAMSKARPGLKVVAVSTLDQALRVIGANGGKLSPTTLDSAPSHYAG